MRSRIKKNRAIIASIILLATVSVLVVTCDNPAGPKNATTQPGIDLPDTPDGITRLVVAMHDEPFRMDDKDVQELNLTVEQIVIIDSNDQHITILSEERQMELLSISRSNPVVLSDVSVEPGVYKELRLVLKGNSTIKVDGELHPIKVPSGSQSGLKLKGPFVIPQGKLFRLVIDFVAAESVHWNKGQGWMLKPVLRISDTAEIIGIFRGNLSVSGDLGARETLLQLYANNTARLRIADYPNYTLHCNYAYNSASKQLAMTNISLDAPGLRKRELREVMKQLPHSFTLPVKQWAIDNIIAVDTGGLTCNLYRVDAFNFSQGVSYTEFTLNIDYPDMSKNGKDVLTEIRFVDTGMPPLTLMSEFDGKRITETVRVLNSYIQGGSTRLRITSYLFDDPSGINIEAGIAAGLPAVYMSGAHFSETTNNPWRQEENFTVIRNGENQEFSIQFPQRMNIRMDHRNFTNNAPLVSWDPYPHANGYFVMTLVQEKNKNPNRDTASGSEFWAVAYYEYTQSTEITVRSEKISFTPIYSTQFVENPKINAGDFIRIEVYALDGSGSLDTKTRTGALYMDPLNIIR